MALGRRALCEELLKLRRKHADAYVREKEIKAALLKDASENAKEVIDGLGFVRISAPKPKRCTGTAPEIVVEAFLTLPEKERSKLTEKGLVKIAEQWKDAYYGSISPELF